MTYLYRVIKWLSLAVMLYIIITPVLVYFYPETLNIVDAKNRDKDENIVIVNKVYALIAIFTLTLTHLLEKRTTKKKPERK